MRKVCLRSLAGFEALKMVRLWLWHTWDSEVVHGKQAGVMDGRQGPALLCIERLEENTR